MKKKNTHTHKIKDSFFFNVHTWLEWGKSVSIPFGEIVNKCRDRQYSPATLHAALALSLPASLSLGGLDSLRKRGHDHEMCEHS